MIKTTPWPQTLLQRTFLVIRKALYRTPSRAWMYNKLFQEESTEYETSLGTIRLEFSWVLPIYFLGNHSFPWWKSYLRVHLTDLWRNIVLVPIYNFIYIKIGDVICVWLPRHCPQYADLGDVSDVRILKHNADPNFVPAIKKSPRFYAQSGPVVPRSSHASGVPSVFVPIDQRSGNEQEETENDGESGIDPGKNERLEGRFEVRDCQKSDTQLKRNERDY